MFIFAIFNHGHIILVTKGVKMVNTAWDSNIDCKENNKIPIFSFEFKIGKIFTKPQSIYNLG